MRFLLLGVGLEVFVRIVAVVTFESLNVWLDLDVTMLF